MPSPQRQERRYFRYPLHLPVLIRMARKEMHTRSENISLGGILLSSASFIPEGSTVDVAVGVENLPDPGILLNARGKVLRTYPKETGDFAVAIQLDRSFELPVPGPDSHFVFAAKAAQSSASGPLYGKAWDTET
jgi:PilZ domain